MQTKEMKKCGEENMTKTIHELLSDPDSLAKLSTAELTALLAPFIPAARKAVLPEEKPFKVGMAIRTMTEVMNNPAFKAQMEALRNSKK